MKKQIACGGSKLILMLGLALQSFSLALAAPCAGPTVLWHNLSDTGCGAGQTNPGITADVIDQNIDVIGTNALVDGIHVQSISCDVLITITNGDAVITGSGNRCDSILTNSARLYLYAATGRTITFQLGTLAAASDLLFRGTANGATRLDLLVTVSGGGTVDFVLSDTSTVTFGSLPTSGATQFFVGMDAAPNIPVVEFTRLNTNTSANVEVIVGDRSTMSFMSASSGTSFGSITFNPSNQLLGKMILRLLSCGTINIASHLLTVPLSTANILLANINLASFTGNTATMSVATNGSNVNAFLQIINENQCCTNLVINPFCDNAFTGTQKGFVLGPIGTLLLNDLTYLDYIGTATNTCCSYTFTDLCGIPHTGTRLRNPSAFIVDALDDSNPVTISLNGRSAIYFRSGVDNCGVVDEANGFLIDPDKTTPCLGNIVFDVEGPLNVNGVSPVGGTVSSGLNILSLQVTPTGCPVLLGNTGPSLFPARTFNRDSDGVYLRYNSGAFLINNQLTYNLTVLIHTDENHAVFQQGNRGDSSLSSEPAYVGGDSYILCAGIVGKSQCRPAMNFINSQFRVHTSIASAGVDFTVPDSVGVANASQFIFYNNGICIDKGYGRNWIMGTDPCFDHCYTTTNSDSHLNVQQVQLDNSGASSIELRLQAAMNDACITEGITPITTGSAVQTLFLNNASNISVGNLGTTGFDCFGNQFTFNVPSSLLVDGSVFSFETRGGDLCYPQSSGTTGKGGIFVDTNGTFNILNNNITNIATMVTKSGNAVINLPTQNVFFAPRVGIQEWELNLNPGMNPVIIAPTDHFSDYTLDWGNIQQNYCCSNNPLANCFRPYQVLQVPPGAACQAVTAQNLTALPTIMGEVDQFQILRSRIGDPVHFVVDGGLIRESVFLVGFNSAEAPVGFLVVQNGGDLGLGTAHRNVDSLEASVMLGINGVQICANGDGAVHLNENILINNVCPILTGTAFGVGQQQVLKIYSTLPVEFRIKSTGVLDLTQFTNPNQVLQFAGQVTVIAEPGSRILMNGGILQFVDEAKFNFDLVLNEDRLPATNTASTDNVRVRMSGSGEVIFSDDSSMFIPRSAYFGIETFAPSISATSLTFRLQDQASLQIGSEEAAGGAFQIGNTTAQTGHTIDFTLILEGMGALFQIDRQGFFGLGTGIVSKQSQIPNLWTVANLSNVRNVSIFIDEGTFQHNQIVTGDDSLASLLAIGNVGNYTFNFDQDLSQILGGGNMTKINGASVVNPIVQTTAGVQGSVQASIMAGKWLLVDPSKGAQPTSVTPQALFNYLQTTDYTVPNYKRGNAASEQLNIMTIGFIRNTTAINRVDFQQGFLLGLDGFPVDFEHSLQIGAVSILIDPASQDLALPIEIMGAGVS